MIGYNRLGSNGFLGNQMFQYAGVRGIAKNLNYDWMIPPPDNYYEANYGLFECFKMESVSSDNFGLVNLRTHESETYHFSKDFFDTCPDNVNLNDYFQTEKYFSNVEEIIRSDYTFKDEILERCQPIIDSLKNPIFLHVRRGDYLNVPDFHPACSIEYYEKALSYFDDNCEVIICSNDIQWCKNQKLFSSDRFLISEGNDRYDHRVAIVGGYDNLYIPYYDLCLMSLCNGGIMANSSFSWWGAWLIKNQNKIIVAPKRWFGNSYPLDHAKDIIPDGWIVI